MLTEERGVNRISKNDDFHRYLMSGHPVIVVDEVPNWIASKKWNLDYLRLKLGHREEFAFIDKKLLSFSEFADKLETTQPSVYAPQLSLTGRATGDLDTNAFELKDDVECPSLIDKSSLDEINVWIGRGLTPLHFDGYDNFLAVVRGKKHVLLLEPKWFEDLYIDNFQWSSVDITRRDLERFPRLAAVPEPIEIVVNEGEMLFIPAHWLHQVDVPQGYSIALNYWYRSQHGQPSSGFSEHFRSALVNALSLYGELNDAEKQDAMRRIRGIADQLGEGRSPASQKNITWSSGWSAFSDFRI